MKSLLGFLWKDARGLVIFSILAGVASGLCGVALIALVYSELASAQGSGAVLGLAFAGLCLTLVVARVTAQALMVRLGQGSVTRLSLALCKSILALPLAAFEQMEQGGLIAALTEDVVIVASALVGIPLVCINVPIVFGCFVYVGWLSPPALAVGTVFTLAAIAGYLVLSARGLHSLRLARQEQDALVGHFRALIEGFRELKGHSGRRAAFVAQALEPALKRTREETVAGLTHYAIAGGFSQLAFFGFIGLALFVLPPLLKLDRAVVSGLVLVVLYLMSPFDVVLTWVPLLARARASLAKLQDLLPRLDACGLESAIGHRPRPAAIPQSLGLEGVAYAYAPEAHGAGFVLGPVSVTLRRGEIVFLCGGNGSGKTTFVKLLAGLYTPQTGTVRVDGQPVVFGPEGLEDYRQLFSVLFADGYLFDALYGLEGPESNTHATQALKRLELDRQVLIENGRFSTLSLSQGQRRRLALLAALLEDRPILVFDEWAAYQDPHFKQVFYQSVLPELKARGKIVLVISHDEHYYDAADRIIRFHEGQVREETRARACQDRDAAAQETPPALDGSRFSQLRNTTSAEIAP